MNGLRKRDVARSLAEVGVYIIISLTLVVLPFSANGLI